MGDFTISYEEDDTQQNPLGSAVDDTTRWIAEQTCGALKAILANSDDPPILWLVQRTGLDRRMVNRVLNGDIHMRMDEFIHVAHAVGLAVKISFVPMLDKTP